MKFLSVICAILVTFLPVESFAQQVSGPTTTAVTQTAGNSSSKIANTSFVGTAINNALAGINPAVAVQAATTAASNTSSYTYNNGVSGIGATLTGVANTALTVDGYTFTAVGQRLLVKNDTQSPSGAFNGVYSVTQVQTGILPLILTRALDYDMPSDINNTGAIPVQNGTVNGSTSYAITSQVTTVGTDPLTFTQFSLNPTTVVVGPASATDGNLVVFNGTSGKLVKDGGSATKFSFSFVQEVTTFSTANATSFTITFPQATASSGNTAFMLVSADGSQAVTTPAGWTADINQASTNSRFILLHKTTASDTSAAFTTSGTASYAIMFFELTGARSLDVSTTSSTTNPALGSSAILPAITPTSGSLVFGAVSETSNNGSGTFQTAISAINPNWKTITVSGGAGNARILIANMSLIPGAGASALPPAINNWSNTLFPSAGIAYSSFSIK